MWEAVQRDWRTAPVSAQLRATLGFLEKLTLHPAEVTREDANAVRAAGVSDEALVDAIQKLTEVVNDLQERINALEAKGG